MRLFSYLILCKKMAVKVTEKSESKITLEIDNGDKEKLEKVLEKWNFKDHQSLFRFAISILYLTEDNTLWINEKGEPNKIQPSDDLINLKTEKNG